MSSTEPKKPRRPKLKDKRTKNKRIMGRPVKGAETLIAKMPAAKRDSPYDDTLLIIQAIMNVGKRHGAQDAQTLEAERGHEVMKETVRRRMRRIRAT